ncbi:MAG: succinyl transferase OpgC, partial [Alphaproteobacteria bacterium]|nr:succinyl transferase OpgC [Alphaproteobacteria bacterium]
MTPSASPKSDPRELVFSESGRSRHIKTIDGLRGLALLMVLYQHIMAPAVSKQVIKKLGFACFIMINKLMIIPSYGTLKNS